MRTTGCRRKRISPPRCTALPVCSSAQWGSNYPDFAPEYLHHCNTHSPQSRCNVGVCPGKVCGGGRVGLHPPELPSDLSQYKTHVTRFMSWWCQGGVQQRADRVTNRGAVCVDGADSINMDIYFRSHEKKTILLSPPWR